MFWLCLRGEVTTVIVAAASDWRSALLQGAFIHTMWQLKFNTKMMNKKVGKWLNEVFENCHSQMTKFRAPAKNIASDSAKL